MKVDSQGCELRKILADFGRLPEGEINVSHHPERRRMIVYRVRKICGR